MAEQGPPKGPPGQAPPAGSEAEPPPGEARERRGIPILEGAIADMLRRDIEAGWDRLGRGERGGAIRAALAEMRLPKEIAGYVGSQLDDTKNAILKVVSKEIREFLETSHFADELARLLTTLTFEITTQVRFVPNEEGKRLRPKVSSQVRMRRKGEAAK
jgi:hypothetical protein